MGYWEQVGEENRRHEERRVAMRPLRRRVSDVPGSTLVIAASLLLLTIMLAPLLLWLPY